MILLPNGCTMSTPVVFPANWKTPTKASMKLNWYISYRFYDPKFSDKFPKGKQRFVKHMNRFTIPSDRIAFTMAAINDCIKLHREEGYNLISETYYTAPEKIDYIIHPDTPVCMALDKALEFLKCEKRTIDDVRNSLTHIKKSIKALGYDHLSIYDFKRRHMRVALDNCKNVKTYWSPTLFNNYRKYLSMLYKQLLEIEAVEYNPLIDIAKEKTVTKIRTTLTMDERIIIDQYFFKNYQCFWRYMNIFFHSGRRTSELLKIKKEDVDLKNQRFKILEKKGKKHVQKWGVIKNVAMPLWIDIMNDAKENEYLFSLRLKPGVKCIRPDQITKTWNRHVKTKLNIQADFYSLKHSNADEIASKYGIGTSQQFIGHSSEKTTRIYAVNQKDRDMEMLKELDNKFA